MKIALISFTGEGAKTCRKIETGLTARGYECSAFGKSLYAKQEGVRPLERSLDEWTAEAFCQQDALVFIGAAGIAVRAIAPYVRDKTKDPAVIVVDEKGLYSISLLSGHLGGANDMAMEIAELIGAEPVITTATDLSGLFAVDDWAKKNHLQIGEMQLAKEISAAIVNGETVGVFSDVPIEGELPKYLQYLLKTSEGTGGAAGSESELVKYPKLGFRISISEEDGPFEKTLHLIPKTVTLGMGCRKGVSLEAAEELLNRVLNENKLSVKSIEKLCTIDIKKEETALQQLAGKLGVPLQVFSSEELLQADGEFAASDFVSQITGVDNVCERAAVLGSKGELIVKKQALNGVTAAMAVRTEGGCKWKQQ